MINNLCLLFVATAAITLYFINDNTTSENFAAKDGKNVKSQDLVSNNGRFYLKGNPKQGVLFAITADWCGYCTKLKNAVKDSGITAYYFDATDNNNSEIQNKLGEMNVNSFPTIFKVGNGGELVPYNGSRDVGDLRKNFL
jgi:glutaredoxin